MVPVAANIIAPFVTAVPVAEVLVTTRAVPGGCRMRPGRASGRRLQRRVVPPMPPSRICARNLLMD